jgi:hypothetical protein
VLVVLWFSGVLVVLGGHYNSLLVAGVLAMVAFQVLATVILRRADPERLYDDMRILFLPWVAIVLLLLQMQ